MLLLKIITITLCVIVILFAIIVSILSVKIYRRMKKLPKSNKVLSAKALERLLGVKSGCKSCEEKRKKMEQKMREKLKQKGEANGKK